MSDIQVEGKKFEVNLFLQNLVKLVPIEFVVLWAVVTGFIPTDADPIQALIVLGAITVIVPLYFVFAMKVKDVGQIIVTTLAFPIWALVVGGIPLQSAAWYSPWMVSVALAIFTFIPPMFFGQRVDIAVVENLARPAESVTTATSARVKSWRQV